MLPSKFHWGLLCYLAHALHPAELKCSQLKGRWRQQLCGMLKKAGKGKGWKVKKYSDAVRNDPHHCLAPLRSSHLTSLCSSSGNTKQILLTSVWSTQLAVAEEDRQPVHDSFSLPLSPPLSPALSLTTPLFSSPAFVWIFLPLLPAPLRQRRTKREKEEKQYNLLGLIWEHTRACLASDTALPVLWRSSSPFDFSQMVQHSDRCSTFHLPLWHPSL